MKSERSGEIWVIQALSSKNGDVSKERVVRREDVGRGAAVTATRSKSAMFLLLSCQSMEAWRDSWVASQEISAICAYSAISAAHIESRTRGLIELMSSV